MIKHRLGLLAASLCVLQGCTSMDSRPPLNAPGYTANEPQHRYSVEANIWDGRPPEHPKASKHVFVGVSISGGGTRAANFGLSVLRELEEMGVLEHVTVLSSVSGGSLAAAYYAVDGVPSDDIWKGKDDQLFVASRSGFWEKTKTLFVQDFRTQIMLRYLRPDNLLATLATSKTRTDLLSEVLDDKVFQRRTFKALQAHKKENCHGALECLPAVNAPFRPRLRINATIANQLPLDLDEALPARRLVVPAAMGQPFSFTATGFQPLNSDILSFRISDAVSASAAFPGLFGSVSLAAYERDSNQIRGYVKLIDGGPSDNLGTEALIDSLTQWWQLRKLEQPKESACFLIVVDAFAGRTTDPTRFLQRDDRRWYDRIIDTNFLDAFDAFLARRRELALEAIGVPISTMFGATIVADPVTGRVRAIRRKSDRFNPAVHMSSWYSRTEASPTCAVWRVSLDDVEQDLAKLDNTGGFPSEAKTAKLSEELWNTSAVSWLSTSTKTDFDLVGPPDCSSDILQDALWDSAKILVRDDSATRLQVCRWLRDHGIATRTTCDTPAPRPFRREKYPVQAHPKTPAQGIACVKPASSTRSLVGTVK